MKIILYFVLVTVAISAFVSRNGTRFMLSGKPYYYGGTNCYYLNFRGEKASHYLYEAANKFQSQVIRTWGFRAIGSLDGTSMPTLDPSANVYFQYWDPVEKKVKINHGPNGLQLLDRTVHLASRYGIKLIIAFTNNWKDFGGIDQYVRWFGHKNHDDFYSRIEEKTAYKEYVHAILERVNIYSGVKYKSDPTIFAWQLGNELRIDGDTYVRSLNGTVDVIHHWTKEMSDYIRSIDGNHMISVGDEGWFNISSSTDWTYNGLMGIDVERNSRLPNIDFITFHMYPETWMKPIAWTEKWIIDHVNLCQRIGKPCVFAEYGSREQSMRLRYYQTWLKLIEQHDVAGSNFWMISDRDDNGNRIPDYDGYTLYAIEGESAHTVQQHSIRLNNKTR